MTLFGTTSRRRLLAFALSVWTASIAGAAAAAPDDPKILMLLWRGATVAEDGFLDGLRDAGLKPDLRMVDIGQDKKILVDFLRATAIAPFDLVYTFGTTTAMMARPFIKDARPHIFNAVSDPIAAGLVDDLDDPRNNVSGVAYHAVKSTTDLLALAQTMAPVTHLGVLFHPLEKQSAQAYFEARSYLARNGGTTTPFRIGAAMSTLPRVVDQLQSDAGKYSAIYIPSDSYIISHSRLVFDALAEIDVPVLGAHETFVQNGAVLGFNVDYYKAGLHAAEAARRALQNGSAAGIPVRKLTPRLVGNAAAAARFGLSLPPDVALVANPTTH
ncbi:MAG: ABC transporter substrate binding protein [Pseudomonadota bacterium]